jgi:hypothetical protein
VQLVADSGAAAKPTRFAIEITASDYEGNRVAGAKFQLVQGDKVLFTTLPTGPKGITRITNVPILSEEAEEKYAITHVAGTPSVNSFTTEGPYDITNLDMKTGDEGNLKTVEGKPLPQLELFFKVLGPRDTYVAAATARTNAGAAARLAEVAERKAQKAYDNTSAIRMNMPAHATWKWGWITIYVVGIVVMLVVIVKLFEWIGALIEDAKRAKARGSGS